MQNMENILNYSPTGGGTTGAIHVCPHPFEQHFWSPSQELSALHISEHIPIMPSILGHSPDFTVDQTPQ